MYVHELAHTHRHTCICTHPHTQLRHTDMNTVVRLVAGFRVAISRSRCDDKQKKNA